MQEPSPTASLQSSFAAGAIILVATSTGVYPIKIRFASLVKT